MKSALEVLKVREEKKQQKIKENAVLVNTELLEIEKVLNKYESDVEDTKLYVTIPMIIRTKEVKELLNQNGYIIDKISNNIEYGTTRIYLDEKEYNAVVKLNYITKTLKEPSENNKIRLEPKIKNSANIDNVEELFKRMGWF